MDVIADMLIKIKNGQQVFRETVSVPFSALKYEIAKIMEREGFIKGVEKKKKKIGKESRFQPGPILEITLKYDGKSPIISQVKRVSKPGQRIYLPSAKIRRVRGGQGLAIISTSKGLMSDQEARKSRIGGEVICEVW
ncbi:MAG: 30S ribosomal protein S8 [Candidatus Nealsonbacteria bacterium]|nr:30S ribosomal protein S8 [Candidatus Nealsonbacteria bacterium]